MRSGRTSGVSGIHQEMRPGRTEGASWTHGRCIRDAPKVRPGCGTLWFPSDNVGSPAHLRPSGRLAFCTPGNPAREPVSEITKHLPAIGLMKELVARTFVDS